MDAWGEVIADANPPGAKKKGASRRLFSSTVNAMEPP
jgi:hypothetical protein